MKPCSYPGCKRLVQVGTAHCQKHAAVEKIDRGRAYDDRRKDRPSRRWYNLKAWKIKRAALFDAEPLCRMCPAESKRPATIADHIEPHKENYVKFWHGELQPLCKWCHDIKKQRIEKRHSAQSETDSSR